MANATTRAVHYEDETRSQGLKRAVKLWPSLSSHFDTDPHALGM
jgi:hypothetical protein